MPPGSDPEYCSVLSSKVKRPLSWVVKNWHYKRSAHACIGGQSQELLGKGEEPPLAAAQQQSLPLSPSQVSPARLKMPPKSTGWRKQVWQRSSTTSCKNRNSTQALQSSSSAQRFISPSIHGEGAWKEIQNLVGVWGWTPLSFWGKLAARAVGPKRKWLFEQRQSD